MKRHPFKVVVVTGAPGVGKTTVLTLLSKLLEERKARFIISNFGDYMLKAAVKAGYAKTRDEIRKLNQRVQLGLQELAAELIIRDAEEKIGEDGVLIVDTHSIIKTRTGLWPGLPENVVKTLLPDAIVLIEAKPEVILERQLRDKTRDRGDVADVEFLREFLAQARIAAIASAVHTASAVVMVENPEGEPIKAAETIMRIIETI